jgi:hypothetical protein
MIPHIAPDAIDSFGPPKNQPADFVQNPVGNGFAGSQTARRQDIRVNVMNHE